MSVQSIPVGLGRVYLIGGCVMVPRTVQMDLTRELIVCRRGMVRRVVRLSKDCADGSDEGAHCVQERNVTESCEVEQGWFPCEDGSRCLHAEHVCDNIEQCGDGSDEGEFCTKPDCSTISCSLGCIMTS